MIPIELLPNLGAEEGNDWQAYRSEARVRMAARLWALLFSGESCLYVPDASDKKTWQQHSCADLWPEALGPVPTEAVFDWLAAGKGPRAWLNTESAEREARERFSTPLSGPAAECVARVHDKAFAIKAARELGLLSGALETAIQVIDPASLRSPETLVRSLDAALQEWPDWTRREFTLKPRRGSSGRGRVGGINTVDRDSIRGAFPRLANRGGAIFEPWLSRMTDLSVSLLVPTPDQPVEPTTILGSLEMLVTASGVYRGHCGEVDSRGRIFSGHPDDETLRADAASVANLAREKGFSGPCGIDAFSYLESDRERLRSLVEFNGRMTMGGVAIGLVRRALSQVREGLELTPGERRGFLFTFIEPRVASTEQSGTEDALDELIRASDSKNENENEMIALDLSSPDFESDGRPILIFARNREPLRQAHRDLFGC